MKIYTRTGDDGTTGLIGGGRVSKSDPRIATCGAIDELNAAMGWCVCALTGDKSDGAAARSLIEPIQRIQGELFVIGAHLAAVDPAAAKTSVPELSVELIARLEAEIDQAAAHLPPLSNFILPGGTEAAGRLHLARTICRRAERAVVGLGGEGTVNAMILRYVNRLSDWLFAYARLANHLADVGDVPWRRA